MIGQYINAVLDALGGVLHVFAGFALPLAIVIGAATVGALTVARRNGEGPPTQNGRLLRNTLGYVFVGLLSVAIWSALKVARPAARQAIAWRESAEATANPAPDAPAVHQYGPSVGFVAEKTYTRTLTLPPDFLQRVGEYGVGVLAPYLSDPSAESVTKLSDTFRRSGRDVVFTREVTRQDETPVPFTSSNVQVQFKRLPGRAYDAQFEGRYTWTNPGSESVNARFTFAVPEAGTVRDLSLTVNGQTITEPSDGGAYVWNGPVGANEKREAVVRYRVVGARTWQYDIGSQRRRVQQFSLQATPNGAVRYLRGSLQPSRVTNSNLHWELANVLTTQRVAIAFPPDIVGRDSFLQALSALPAAFWVFLAGIVAVGLMARQPLVPGTLALALVLFAFGLFAAPVLANYIGPIAAVLLGPLAGAIFVVRKLGHRFAIPAFAAALVPGTFLSPTHTGLLLLVLVAVALGGMVLPSRFTPASEGR